MQTLKSIPAQLKLKLQTARARYAPIDVVAQTFKQFSLDDGGTYAAALTYYMFFSIFPLFLFSASVLGFVTAGNDELRQEIISRGVNAVPLVSDILSVDTLETIERNRGSLALTALLFTLYAGSGGVVALQHALNRIVGAEDEGNVLLKRVRSVMWLGIFGVAVLLSIALGTVAAYATQLVGGGTDCADAGLSLQEQAACGAENGGITPTVALAWTLGHVVGFVVGVVMFAGAYRFLPRADFSLREVLPGAIVAALLFEVLKEVGSAYLAAGSARREATFGAFALAAGLLVASYLIAQVTLLSAELNDVLRTRRATRTGPAG